MPLADGTSRPPFPVSRVQTWQGDVGTGTKVAAAEHTAAPVYWRGSAILADEGADCFGEKGCLLDFSS